MRLHIARVPAAHHSARPCTLVLFCNTPHNLCVRLNFGCHVCKSISYKYRWLYSNQLTELPPQLGQLQRLRKLWADRNQLSSVPEALGNCAELQVGYAVVCRQLKDDCFWVTAVTAVVWVDRSQLSSVPEELGDCAELQVRRGHCYRKQWGAAGLCKGCQRTATS